MTLAATPTKVRQPAASTPVRAGSSRRYFRAWQLLPVVLFAALGFLGLTPDGIAEPVQDLAGWLVVGVVACLAVLAIVTVLDRLLDCEGN